jgi:hypothetical protein
MIMKKKSQRKTCLLYFPPPLLHLHFTPLNHFLLASVRARVRNNHTVLSPTQLLNSTSPSLIFGARSLCGLRDTGPAVCRPQRREIRTTVIGKFFASVGGCVLLFWKKKRGRSFAIWREISCAQLACTICTLRCQSHRFSDQLS